MRGTARSIADEVRDARPWSQEFRNLTRAVALAGFNFEPPLAEPMDPLEWVHIRYMLIASYYAHGSFHNLTLRLSHDWPEMVLASGTGAGYTLPKFKPDKQRGPDNVRDDLAILRRDKCLMDPELQALGDRAIVYLEMHEGMREV